MSFGHRLHDGEGFVQVETPEVIPIVDILLERLDLESSERGEQIAGIRAWLRSHQPSRSLIRDLDRQGYSAALDEVRSVRG